MGGRPERGAGGVEARAPPPRPSLAGGPEPTSVSSMAVGYGKFGRRASEPRNPRPRPLAGLSDAISMIVPRRPAPTSARRARSRRPRSRQFLRSFSLAARSIPIFFSPHPHSQDLISALYTHRQASGGHQESPPPPLRRIGQRSYRRARVSLH